MTRLPSVWPVWSGLRPELGWMELHRLGSCHSGATAMRTDVGLEDPSRVGFPTDRFICFPAAGGYIRISAASRHVRPTAEQMRAACLLASQIS